MAYKHMKRFSNSLVIIGMKIKTTKWYHYTAIKWLTKRREVEKNERGKERGERKDRDTEIER